MRWAWQTPLPSIRMPKLDRLTCPPFAPLSQGRAWAPRQGVTAHTSHYGSYRAHTKPFPDTTARRGPSDTLDLPLAPWLPERKDARAGGILCIIFLGGLAQGPKMGAQETSEDQPRGLQERPAGQPVCGPWPSLRALASTQRRPQRSH